MGYQQEWKTAKTNFTKVTGKKKPTEKFLGFFRKRTGVEAALKNFDKAKTFAQKEKACLVTFKSKESYAKVLNASIRENTDIKAELTKLKSTLEDIYKRVEQEAQPVPTGRMVKPEIIRTFKLNGNAKPKWLNMGDITVNAYVEMDSFLGDLFKQQAEGLRIEKLGEAALKAMKPWQTAIEDVIMKEDKRLETEKKEKHAALIKDLNHTLKVHAERCEKMMNQAVERELDVMVGRIDALKSFKRGAYVSIAIKLTTIGVAITSMALTLGAAAVSMLSALKAALEMSMVAAELFEDLGTAHFDVEEDLAYMAKHYDELGGAEKTLKEMLAEASPLSKLFNKSLTSARANLKKLNAKIAEAEKQCDKVVGKLNEALDEGRKIPLKHANDKQKKMLKEIEKVVNKALSEIQTGNKEIVKEINYHKHANQFLAKVEKKQKIALYSGATVKWSARAGGVFAVANFIKKVSTGAGLLF